MEQTKAVWTWEQKGNLTNSPSFFKNGLFNFRIENFSKEEAIILCARLNATEGLNVEALPELIEAAKKLEASDTKYTKNTITVTRDSFAALQSALTKLGE